MTMAPGQMRFINSSLVTSSPADRTNTSTISKARPPTGTRRSSNPKLAAREIDLAVAGCARPAECLRHTKEFATFIAASASSSLGTYRMARSPSSR